MIRVYSLYKGDIHRSWESIGPNTLLFNTLHLEELIKFVDSYIDDNFDEIEAEELRDMIAMYGIVEALEKFQVIDYLYLDIQELC